METTDWMEAAYRAFIRTPPTDHAHERHPFAGLVTLARHREMLAYRLLVLGDASVEAELAEIVAYIARFERLALAKAEQQRQAAGETGTRPATTPRASTRPTCPVGDGRAPLLRDLSAARQPRGLAGRAGPADHMSQVMTLEPGRVVRVTPPAEGDVRIQVVDISGPTSRCWPT